MTERLIAVATSGQSSREQQQHNKEMAYLQVQLSAAREEVVALRSEVCAPSSR